MFQEDLAETAQRQETGLGAVLVPVLADLVQVDSSPSVWEGKVKQGHSMVKRETHPQVGNKLYYTP